MKRRLKQHFDVNADALRQKFREKKWENGSTPKHYVREMEQLLNRWLPEGMDVRELKQMLLIEKILNSLPREMRTFVGERQPKDSGQVIELLQLYLTFHLHERSSCDSSVQAESTSVPEQEAATAAA